VALHAATACSPEYDVASLYLVSFYSYVTKACARRPGATANVERRRRDSRTMLAGAAGEVAGATRLRQARPSSACTFSVVATIFRQAPICFLHLELIVAQLRLYQPQTAAQTPRTTCSGPLMGLATAWCSMSTHAQSVEKQLVCQVRAMWDTEID
jgi:hypothetical protein